MKTKLKKNILKKFLYEIINIHTDYRYYALENEDKKQLEESV
jgi:hypothetical protein